VMRPLNWQPRPAGGAARLNHYAKAGGSERHKLAAASRYRLQPRLVSRRGHQLRRFSL
jgi:hypothetical protein